MQQAMLDNINVESCRVPLLVTCQTSFWLMMLGHNR
jgi:hypothetical protein